MKGGKTVTTATILNTRVEEWDLNLIDDNPFNPRLFYKPAKVAEKAVSIKENAISIFDY